MRKILIVILVTIAVILLFWGNQFINNDNWKTFIDSDQGITFEYPEELPTEYIIAQEWPPNIELRIAQFLCAVPLREINGREYCVGEETEGAAGSIYTTYTYNTIKNEKMIVISFTLRYLQCGNYSEPRKTECESEREIFDLDSLVDQIAQSVREN